MTNIVQRAAITSYFTEQEKREIMIASGKQGISMSAFVAAAALKDARRLNASHPAETSDTVPKKDN